MINRLIVVSVLRHFWFLLTSRLVSAPSQIWIWRAPPWSGKGDKRGGSDQVQLMPGRTQSSVGCRWRALGEEWEGGAGEGEGWGTTPTRRNAAEVATLNTSQVLLLQEFTIYFEAAAKPPPPCPIWLPPPPIPDRFSQPKILSIVDYTITPTKMIYPFVSMTWLDRQTLYNVQSISQTEYCQKYRLYTLNFSGDIFCFLGCTLRRQAERSGAQGTSPTSILTMKM